MKRVIVGAAELLKGMKAIQADAAKSPYATLGEYHVKVILANELLKSGCHIVEGAPLSGHGHAVSMDGRNVRFTNCKLPECKTRATDGRAGYQPDLRLWFSDTGLWSNVELKTASEFGTKSQLNGLGLMKDLENLRRGNAQWLVFLAAESKYAAIRPDDTKRGHGNAAYSRQFQCALPALHSIPTTLSRALKLGPDGRYLWMGVRFVPRFLIQGERQSRILLAIAKAPPRH